MNNNPRITTYVSSTKDQNNALRIIQEFKTKETPTLHYVLSQLIECSILKNESVFIEIIFQQHLFLVLEMFQWMLTPKYIANKKKVSIALDFYPSRVKQLIKDNVYFYEQLYIAVRNGKFPLSACFNFLRPQFFDKQTIYTALGYFGETMIPFAKYEFSGSLNITQFDFGCETDNDDFEALSIMKILPKVLIDELIDYANYESVFQFIKTAVLISIEESEDYEISKYAILKLLLKAQDTHIYSDFSIISETNGEFGKQIDLLENVTLSLKEVIANIQPGNNMQLRTQSFIEIIVESKIIKYAATQIMESSFCNQVPPKAYSTIYSRDDVFSSQEIPSPTLKSVKSVKSTLSLTQGNIQNKNTYFLEYSEQDLMEVLLKLLTFSVQIFIRIPKTVSTFINAQLKSSQANSTRQTTPQNYNSLLMNFKDQIQYLLDKLQVISKLVYNEYDSMYPTKQIAFSSGQKIKPISLMKHEYLKLIHSCLMLLECGENTENKKQKIKISDKPIITINSKIQKNENIGIFFEINLQKLRIIETVQKYLNENRWNNIVHHTIEKICHLLVTLRYDYMSKKIEQDKNKKITEGFLAFLIQNFTQRDYIFLGTFKFTNQGNLQSIYNISKDLAFTMNNTNQLIIFLNDFQPWKKFLMNDLKLYEEKTYPKAIQPEEIKEEQSPNKEIGLKVDEVDTIRHLIQNISTTKKWPTRISKHKGSSKSGIIRNNDGVNSGDENSPMTRSQGFYLRPRYNSSQLRSEHSPTIHGVQYRKLEASYGSEVQDSEIDKLSLAQEYEIEEKSKSQIIERKDLVEEKYAIFKNYAESSINKNRKL